MLTIIPSREKRLQPLNVGLASAHHLSRFNNDSTFDSFSLLLPVGIELKSIPEPVKAEPLGDQTLHIARLPTTLSTNKHRKFIYLRPRVQRSLNGTDKRSP